MVSIKKATAADVRVIHQLANAIWPISYNGIITDEQIAYMLQLIYSEAALTEQIDVLKHQFLIAYEDEKPVGYASFSPKLNDNTGIFRLNKLYVHPNQQGKGTGKLLLEHVIENAVSLGATALELNVNKQNPAIGFYKKNDFIIEREEVLDIGEGFVMDDFIMQKKLTVQ